MNYKPTLILVGLLLGFPAQTEHEGEIHQGDDMIFSTAHKLFPNTTIASSSFEITQEDIDKISLTDSSNGQHMRI